MTQQTGNRRCPLLFVVLLFIALLLAQALVGCGSVSQAQAGAEPGTPPVSSHQATQTPGLQVTQKPTTVPTQGPSAQTTPQPTISPAGLHGPTNFLLNTPFHFSSANGVTTDTSGATTPLDATNIKSEITQELQHVLFVIDSSDNVKVYSRGESPVAAQVSSNPDGSTALNYTQTANSDAGTVSILFSGVLSNKQITINYEQQYTPSALINAQASDVVVTFTAPVQWVAPKEIPAAPSNGTYQTTKQGGVALAWSTGQNAAAYNVYRQISDQNQQFQLLATVKGSSYIDNSTAAIQNIHATKGITYAIFSVGPTGVENPGGMVISL